ncbi:hypothetical protein ES703_18509 [subsurface metagenome]
MKAGKIFSILAFPSLFVALFLVGYTFREQLLGIFSSPEGLRNWLASTGIKAPLAFIAVQAVQVIVFFIPGEVPQIAAGFMFGFWIGSLLSILGIALGSSVSFLLSRLLGVPFVYALFKREKVESVRKITQSTRARLSLFLFFLIPGIPKDILCYAAGLTPMKLHLFLVLSMLGRLPGILGSALMGDAAAARRWILAAAVLFFSILLFLIGFFLKGKIQAMLEKLSGRI